MSIPLNQLIRQATAKAIVDDTPSVYYEDQIRDVIMNDRLPRVPDIIRRVWENPETRGFLAMSWDYHSNFMMPFTDIELSEAAENEVDALMKKKQEQFLSRQELYKRLLIAFQPIRNTKQFAERFPEFVRYLPAEVGKTENLPAIANLVKDLVQLGWPKGGHPQEA